MLMFSFENAPWKARPLKQSVRRNEGTPEGTGDEFDRELKKKKQQSPRTRRMLMGPVFTSLAYMGNIALFISI